MQKLPSISGKECVQALKKTGFYFKRQEGSHIVMRRENPFAQIVVPNHAQIDKGTLRSILRQAGLSIEEFNRLL